MLTTARKEAFYGKELIVADRDMVETESDEILRGADKEEGGMEVAQLERDVLRPAALDAMRVEREGRAPSLNATETFPVYVVQVKRSKPGRLPVQLTSWAWS